MIATCHISFLDGADRALRTCVCRVFFEVVLFPLDAVFRPFHHFLLSLHPICRSEFRGLTTPRVADNRLAGDTAKQDETIMDDSPLGTLPPELRVRITRYVFHRDQPIDIREPPPSASRLGGKQSRSSKSARKAARRKPSLIAFPLTCKQLYTETYAECLASTKFRFRLSRAGHWRFEKFLLGPRVKKSLRHVEFRDGHIALDKARHGWLERWSELVLALRSMLEELPRVDVRLRALSRRGLQTPSVRSLTLTPEEMQQIYERDQRQRRVFELELDARDVEASVWRARKITEDVKPRAHRMNVPLVGRLEEELLHLVSYLRRGDVSEEEGGGYSSAHDLPWAE